MLYKEYWGKLFKQQENKQDENLNSPKGVKSPQNGKYVGKYKIHVFCITINTIYNKLLFK